MIKFIVILLLFIYTNSVFSQSGINNYLEYSGSSTATNIVGNEIFTYTKTGGGTWTKATIVRIPHATTLSIKHNSQNISNHNITSNPAPDHNPVVTKDKYDNYYSSFEVTGPLTSLTLFRSYNASTNVSIPSVCFADLYPLENIPSDVQKYTNATTNIQSDRANIKSHAESLVENCESEQCAIQKIAKWVRGNIQYQNYYIKNDQSSGSIPQDALSVFNERTLKDENGNNITGRFGNCSGFANIAIALLRSIDIPARYVAGISIKKEFTMPCGTGCSFTWGGWSNNFHAMHEVFYPSIDNWVRNDPQKTVHFGTTNFIVIDEVPDNSESQLIINISHPSNQPQPIITSARTVNTTIGSVNPQYVFHDFSTFNGTINGESLLAVNDACSYVGEFDYVEIKDPPPNFPPFNENTRIFSPGDQANFYAEFDSYTGDTWPTSWDWEMELYHSGGTYTYAEITGRADF